jgi:putative heme degradation protein
MTSMPSFERAIVDARAADAISCTAQMGRVMLTAARHDVTHERIGRVESLEVRGSTLQLGGTAHDATIDLDAVAAVVADRTGRMKDRALPRLQALADDGEILFGLIALDGLDPFDAAIAGLRFGPAPPPPAAPPPAESVPADAGEMADPVLAQAVESQRPVTLRFARPGIVQRWTGEIKAITPAMGFLNVIQPDFHLHVRAGAIASWQQAPQSLELHAITMSGEPNGLVLVPGEPPEANLRSA